MFKMDAMFGLLVVAVVAFFGYMIFKNLFSTRPVGAVWDYTISFKDRQSIPDFEDSRIKEAFKKTGGVDNTVVVESQVSDKRIKELMTEVYGLTPADFSVSSARKFFNF
ncbi:hypothetical protein AAK996_02240 [Streptococcus merionis]